MAKWLAKEFDWDTGKYTGNYYDIAEAGIVAVFVDSFYGDDTAAGTAAAPFKTLSKAITTLNSTGANGSRIFMNGIFSETLPAQTYWYQFIGCGGGKNGRTIFYKGLSAYVQMTKISNQLENVQTINYAYEEFIYMQLTTTSNKTYLLNCVLSFCTLASIAGTSFDEQSVFINCKINQSRCKDTSQSSSAYHPKWECINTVIYKAYNPSIRTLAVIGNNCFCSRDEATPGVISFNAILVKAEDIEGQFLNITNADFNVRLTSPLLNNGPVDEITGNPTNIGGVTFGLPYDGLIPEFTADGGATITDLTIDSTGKFTITAPATLGTLETALMDLGNIYPLENIDLFNVFDFLSGEITQGVFEDFVSPRMALTIKLKYGLTAAEVDECPWLLIEYGKQPTFSGTGASRVGNAADTYDPDNFQSIICRYIKLFITLQNNS